MDDYQLISPELLNTPKWNYDIQLGFSLEYYIAYSLSKLTITWKKLWEKLLKNNKIKVLLIKPIIYSALLVNKNEL